MPIPELSTAIYDLDIGYAYNPETGQLWSVRIAEVKTAHISPWRMSRDCGKSAPCTLPICHCGSGSSLRSSSWRSLGRSS